MKIKANSPGQKELQLEKLDQSSVKDVALDPLATQKDDAKDMPKTDLMDAENVTDRQRVFAKTEPQSSQVLKAKPILQRRNASLNLAAIKVDPQDTEHESKILLDIIQELNYELNHKAENIANYANPQIVSGAHKDKMQYYNNICRYVDNIKVELEKVLSNPSARLTCEEIALTRDAIRNIERLHKAMLKTRQLAISSLEINLNKVDQGPSTPEIQETLRRNIQRGVNFTKYVSKTLQYVEWVLKECANADSDHMKVIKGLTKKQVEKIESQSITAQEIRKCNSLLKSLCAAMENHADIDELPLSLKQPSEYCESDIATQQEISEMKNAEKEFYNMLQKHDSKGNSTSVKQKPEDKALYEAKMLRIAAQFPEEMVYGLAEARYEGISELVYAGLSMRGKCIRDINALLNRIQNKIKEETKLSQDENVVIQKVQEAINKHKNELQLVAVEMLEGELNIIEQCKLFEAEIKKTNKLPNAYAEELNKKVKDKFNGLAWNEQSYTATSLSVLKSLRELADPHLNVMKIKENAIKHAFKLISCFNLKHLPKITKIANSSNPSVSQMEDIVTKEGPKIITQVKVDGGTENLPKITSLTIDGFKELKKLANKHLLTTYDAYSEPKQAKHKKSFTQSRHFKSFGDLRAVDSENGLIVVMPTARFHHSPKPKKSTGTELNDADVALMNEMLASATRQIVYRYKHVPGRNCFDNTKCFVSTLSDDQRTNQKAFSDRNVARTLLATDIDVKGNEMSTDFNITMASLKNELNGENGKKPYMEIKKIECLNLDKPAKPGIKINPLNSTKFIAQLCNYFEHTCGPIISGHVYHIFQEMHKEANKAKNSKLSKQESEKSKKKAMTYLAELQNYCLAAEGQIQVLLANEQQLQLYNKVMLRVERINSKI